MGQDTKKQQLFTENMVFDFAAAESNFRRKNKDTLDDIEATKIIFHALVNYIGNFIFQNAKNKEDRIMDYKQFLIDFHEWIHRIEEHVNLLAGKIRI